MSVLLKYPNIQVNLINESEYFEASPLELWYRQGVWRTSLYQKEHLSDYIRMLTLFKGGGLYMDLDFITLKSLDEKIFWNFFPFPKADRSRLTNSMLHLEHGHRLIEEIIAQLVTGYNPNKYDVHGPVLVTKALTNICAFKPGDDSSSCDDIKLIPHKYFYPIPFPQWKKYFEQADVKTMSQLKQSYAAHIWNKASFKTALIKGSDQLYMTLATQHCPLTIEKASEFDVT